jgi:hypothetical protein
MAGTRALFTSIGASALLVVAAALSLLTVSAVFAFGGWSDSPVEVLRSEALVLAPQPPAGGDTPVAVKTASAEPLVFARPQPRPQRSDAASAGDGPTRARPARQPDTRKPDPPTSTPGLNPAVPRPVATPRPQTTAAAGPPTVGDNVRKVGDDVASGVQGTGTALAQVTAPLLPPISAAVQQVFNAVAALLSQTTAGLGGALDALLPPKK